ncbi:uncharacterized protein PG998_003916 [Apiospora kogelbergensis]|uniref:Uncharacterized protein n=1 Tax=Apiospora kogelbergensis TaxID=1337665 RepID=A0AAW0QSQ9_9PEZI
MSDERAELVKKGLRWGWNDIMGWPWFQSTRDGIFLSGPVLDLEKATGEETFQSLEELVGPMRRVLVPWRENPNSKT